MKNEPGSLKRPKISQQVPLIIPVLATREIDLNNMKIKGLKANLASKLCRFSKIPC
jgi:hypothetical protein